MARTYSEAWITMDYHQQRRTHSQLGPFGPRSHSNLGRFLVFKNRVMPLVNTPCASSSSSRVAATSSYPPTTGCSFLLRIDLGNLGCLTSVKT